MLRVDVRREFPGGSVEATFDAEGGVTALFGPSGAGKSTVVNMLAGLERPQAGRIELEGDVLFDAARRIDIAPERRRVGVVFQEDRLFPHMNVRGNLRYGLRRLPAVRRRIEFDPLVALLGLGGLLDRRPATLSGGEKQRVAIGRALLASPRLLLMDEPLANLDAGRRAEILPFLDRLREELALPIVYVSHNVDEILRLADTLVVMGDGRSRAAGPVEEVLSRKDLRQWTGVQDAGSVFAATVRETGADGLAVLAFGGGELRIAGGPPPGTRVRLRGHARDVSLALDRPTNISVLNVFDGKIVALEEDGAQVDVRLDIGVPLWARITRHSANELRLAPGVRVFAMVKAVAVDRESHGPSAGVG
ncbi:MAG: molybdenum ABC transporter ATP-binding protein [Proteobacteria bacterium]|nr:molybdenum ABC transporter ATP-binding protein [Pseudomonadota bacterium]